MIIIGWYSSMEVSLCQLSGDKYEEVLKRMWRSIISSSFNIAQTFKVVGT